MSPVYLMAVIGIRVSERFSLPQLYHFINHYVKDYGIADSHVRLRLLHGPEDVRLVYECAAMVRHYTSGKACVTLVPDELNFDCHRVTVQRQTMQNELPEDSWIVNPDFDELIAFPKLIPDLAKDMESAGHNCLDGWSRDRFAEGFILNPIEYRPSIHCQFPYYYDFTNRGLGANTRKMALFKNCFGIEIGAHWLRQRQVPFSAPEWSVPVLHYKWVQELEHRTRKLRTYAALTPEQYPWLHEYDLLLDCIEGNVFHPFRYVSKQKLTPKQEREYAKRVGY